MAARRCCYRKARRRNWLRCQSNISKYQINPIHAIYGSDWWQMFAVFQHIDVRNEPAWQNLSYKLMPTCLSSSLHLLWNGGLKQITHLASGLAWKRHEKNSTYILSWSLMIFEVPQSVWLRLWLGQFGLCGFRLWTSLHRWWCLHWCHHMAVRQVQNGADVSIWRNTSVQLPCINIVVSCRWFNMWMVQLHWSCIGSQSERSTSTSVQSAAVLCLRSQLQRHDRQLLQYYLEADIENMLCLLWDIQVLSKNIYYTVYI